jgi:hypothetical protein
VGSDVTDHSFDTAFPNNCFQVVANTDVSTGSGTASIHVYDICTGGFGLTLIAAASPAHYIAIGK